MSDRRLIHIVDDDESVRRATQFMLMAAGFAVQTYPSGNAFLQAQDVASGCVLLDIRMPEMDGSLVQLTMNERGIALPVIVLTGHGDVSIAVQAMKLGAVDYLEKPFEKAKLLAAIEVAFERLRNNGEEPDPAHIADARIAALTPREQDVLRGLARGRPNKKIAHELGISPRTVEAHRANLMAKLGVRSFSEALHIAFAAGLDRSERSPSEDGAVG